MTAAERPTVLFGPFIGEYGWELLYWHGWVRRMSRTVFADHHRVACSVAGRRAFYPDVDQFVPIPTWWTERGYSANSYFVDGWRDGLPARRRRARYRQWGVLPRWRFEEEPLIGVDAESAALELLTEVLQDLPDHTRVLAPWHWNEVVEDDLAFGVRASIPPAPPTFAMVKIPFDHQEFRPLAATAEGDAAWTSRRSGQRLIAVYPRQRQIRRSDKNWSSENYRSLITEMQRRYPDRVVAIFGEPGGAWFADGPPPGCIDLINVPAPLRMDIQLAALADADLALGSMSGALLVSLAAGCPSLMWGYEETRARCHEENLMGTPFVFHSQIDPKVSTLLDLVDGMLDGRYPPQPQHEWNTLRDLGIGPVRRWQDNRL
jgi:hypothetical protein